MRAPVHRPKAIGALALHAWETAQAALVAGDAAAALRWLDRAQRLAPGDATVALARATLLLGIDAGAGYASFDELSRRYDVREIWLGLAVANRRRGDWAAASRSLARAMAGHVTANDPALFAAASATAREASVPGWCALLGNGVVSWSTTTRSPVAVSILANERGRQPWIRVIQPDETGIQRMRLPAAARAAGALSVTCDGKHLIGSPISLAAIRRVDGIVTASAAGLSGWAWHPADPETPARLLVRGADGERTIAVLANGPEPDLPADNLPLARRRCFAVPMAALAHFAPPLAITSREGVPLLGSPRDPSFELVEAAAAARTVLHSFPADRRAARSGATRPQIRSTPMQRSVAGIDVITPVVSAADAESAQTLLRTLGKTDRLLAVATVGSPAHIILAAAANDHRFHLVHVPHIAGFAALADVGFRAAATDRDLALLDPQAHLAPGWAASLASAARSEPMIGVAAPLATAIPHVRPRRTEARGGVAGDVVAMPMLHPGCLYFRRACLDSVGGLRTALFSQASSATMDFCLRARDRGWRLIVATATTVGVPEDHRSDQATEQLTASEERLLSRLYPGFSPRAAASEAAIAVRLPQRRANLTQWRRIAPAPAVVLVTHDRGGGVEHQVRRRAQTLRDGGFRPIFLRPSRLPGSAEAGIALDGGDLLPVLYFKFPREASALAKLLRTLQASLVELHHTLGHHPSLLALPKQLGVPYDVHVHDYACLCPRIALVSTDRRHCSEPGAARCEACVADLGRIIEEDIAVAALRRRSAALLAHARQVVVPSQDVAARLARHFPGSRSAITPWDDDAAIAPPSIRPPPAGARRRIGVIGAIGLEKGYDVLLACARDAAARDLHLSFTVVGHTIDDMRLIDTGRVFITGEYGEENVIDLIASQRCDLAFLPSVWPETWSFTLSEAWRAGLRVAAFDLGTPAERIRRTGYGWLLPLGAPPHTVNNALLALA